MDEFPDIPAVQRPPVVLAVLLFVVLFVVLPVGELFGAVPFYLLPAGRWVYVIGAFVACVLVAAIPQRRERRASVAVTVMLVMLCCILLVAGPLAVLDQFFGDFSAIETVSETPSRSGRLVLVHEYVDQGALGGDDYVYVRSGLIPAIVEWRYRVPFGLSDYVQGVAWHDANSVSVDGEVYRVPFPMLVFGWSPGI